MTGETGASGRLGRMRIAILQVAVDDAEPMADRVERVAALVRDQAGADLVVLPELWAHGAFAADSWTQTAEPLDGLTVKALRAAAAELGAPVHMGSVLERVDHGPAAGRLYNTALLLGSDGEVRATYRKIHLFGFDTGEAARLSAGTDLVVDPGLTAPAGGVGLATCYDLRFPEMFRALVDRGAELALVASSWPVRRAAHWRLLVQARAVEDQLLVVACNAVGTHAGVTLAGHSMVVDPWGEILAEAGAAEEVLTVEVDPGTVATTRQRFPVLRDRRL